MPFTAQTGDQQEDLNTYQIRLNWCKILNSVINNHDDLNSRVYNVVTDMLGKHYGHTRSRVIKDSPALIIDTAISGKAAVEISEALESIGFSNYKVILAVDAMGSRLKKEYKSILLGEKRDKFDLVYFDSLFTEDQGPALTNVFGVIYPNLTKALRERFSDSSIASLSWRISRFPVTLLNNVFVSDAPLLKAVYSLPILFGLIPNRLSNI
jgi:hypothetical protein